ncbi:MAG: S49 family peptidase [Alphaproteobacteria bacterium]
MRKRNAGVFRSLPHIADRLFDVPLLVHPRKLRSIVGVIGNEMGVSHAFHDDIVEAASDEFLTAHTHTALPAGMGIAVIPIHGTLVQRGDMLDAMSGLRSYDAIREDFRAALADIGTTAILLDFDSGGGEVAGCFDLADEIARSDKPVYAYANEHCYSAAYALASAADKIFMARTGGVGSIGVVGVHTDQSAFDKEKGFVYTPIYAGAKKIDGWAHGPLSEEAKADYQKSVNRTYGIFARTVAENRGIDEKAVTDTQAGCFTAEDAIAAGLADAVGSFDEVIEMIAADLQEGSAPTGISGQGGREAFSGTTGDQTTEKGTSDMRKLTGKGAAAKDPAKNDKKDKGAQAAADAPADEDPAKEGEEEDETETDEEADKGDAGEGEEDEAPKKEDKKPEAAAAVLSASDAAEISDLCVLYGNASLASGFIRKNMSVEAVRTHLLKKRNEAAAAEKAAGTQVSNAHSGKPAAAESSLVENMQKRFKK